MFSGKFYFNLGDDDIQTIVGELLPTIGPLSDFTVVKQKTGKLVALRNSTVVKIDITSSLNDAFIVETEKIIEQVEFTKMVADSEFDTDKKNFGKKEKNMPNFHSHFHH